MGLAPNIVKKKSFLIKECSRCHQKFGPENFAPVRSLFFDDGVLPICNECVKTFLVEKDWNWDAVDKICQMADIPFVPKEWTRLKDLAGDDVFPKYAEIFLDSQYNGIGWGDYYREFKRLREVNALENELPEINEERRERQREKWGHNYDDEALDYLDSLYNGLMATQNVNGSLQVDQGLKICKISYEIDMRIAAGEDFDKLLASYDKLVKIAEFTPKNVKNLNDFDSTGELIRWMERNGWKNKFYDDVTRDVVDETIKNFQNFNQRLYINENGIGDEITKRIEALQSAKELENYYETDKSYDLDRFDNDGFEDLFGDNDDFDAELEDSNNE